MRVLFVLSLALAACSSTTGTPPCEVPQESRCNGEAVELCAPNGKWVTVLRCGDMGSEWKCTVTPEGPACLNLGK